jgi:hypothetical protein
VKYTVNHQNQIRCYTPLNQNLQTCNQESIRGLLQSLKFRAQHPHSSINNIDIPYGRLIGDPIVQCDNQPEDTRPPLVTGKAPMCIQLIVLNF